MALSIPSRPTAAWTQLELDLGGGNRARVTFDLPFEKAPDGTLRPRTNSEPRIMISTEDAATRLGVSAETVRNWVKAGHLRGGRIGRNYQVCAIHAQQIIDKALAGTPEFTTAR